MDEKIQAARIQGKYGIKIALITGIFTLVAAVIALVPSWLAAKKENAQLKDENAALIAASKDYSEKEQESSIQQKNEKNTSEETAVASNAGWEDFIAILDPYEAKNCYETDIIKMMGTEYHHGLSLNCDYSGLAYYNLEGKYTELAFDFGHVDGSSLTNASLKLYLDGEYIQQIEGTANMVITHYVIPLNHAKQLRIEWSYNDIAPWYGMVNMKIR